MMIAKHPSGCTLDVMIGLTRLAAEQVRLPRRAGVGASGAALFVAVIMCGVAPAAFAEPTRFGLFIGSNAGAGNREPLQHAEADAARIRSVFVELGGMPDENAVLIDAPDSPRILEALRSLAPRIASAPDALFVFYYSGHADDRALLLGDSELPLSELRAALESVPARLHLQIVDACRSGALTRPKGARIGAPFSVHAADAGEGRVVITSSAEWEDAQESDRIGGSFFTFHLAGGLRGAADADGDGSVTLAEAYAYVYGRTVESTLATAAGPQHPTFRYDMRGRGDLILTRRDAGDSAILALAGGGDYLIVDAASARIVAEIRAKPSGDRLSLRPGNYRLSKRTGHALLEGSVNLKARSVVEADASLTELTEYARLVRKGGRGAPFASHALRIESGLRGPLGRGIGASPIARVSWVLALPWFSLKPRATFALPAEVATPRLQLAIRETSFGAEVAHAFDFEAGTIAVGLSAEMLWLEQRDRSGREPRRDAFGFVAGASLSVESPPWHGFSLVAGGELDAYSFPTSDADREPAGTGSLHTALTYRALAGVSYEL